MINNKDRTNSGRFKQLGLWEKVIADPGPTLKAAMNEAVKACSLSREQIVDDMNSIAIIAGISCNGRSQKITVSVFDKWLAPGASAYHIPFRLLHIFCRVVNNNLPLKAYASFFQGVSIVSTDDLKKLQWAKAELEARKNRKIAKYLEKEVYCECEFEKGI